MANIGCLGDIAFTVSSEQVETINKFKWSGAAEYAVHKRHGQNSLTEFVGVEPDTISFELTLSAYLGVKVQQEITKLWRYERSGTALTFVLGRKTYGKYRWVITSHEITAETYDKSGNITSAKVVVNLQEYLRK